MKINKIGKLLVCAALTITGTTGAKAQGTVDDYKRAYALQEKFSSRNIFYSNANPRWDEKNHTFWYIRNTPDGDVLVEVNADKRKETVTKDKAKIEERLKTPSPSGEGWGEASEHHWMEVDDEKDPTNGNELYPRVLTNYVASPDGKMEAFIKDCNVWVRDKETKKATQLSIDGTLGGYYSNRLVWSPDGKYVASCRIKPVSEKRYVYYVESSPTDQLQPKLHKQEYAKPGDELMQHYPCIFSVDSPKVSFLTSANTEYMDGLQYEISTPEWTPDSKGIIFEYNQRGHQVYRVLEMSAETGKVSTLIEETSDKYVCYIRNYRYNLPDGKHIIWMSERSGWGHLYMYALQTEALLPAPPKGRASSAEKEDDNEIAINEGTSPKEALPFGGAGRRASEWKVTPITSGEWYVREVLDVNEEKQQIIFTANGMYKDQDPYLIYYYRVNFDGTGLTCLTPDEGTHRAWFSADKKYLVDQYSMIDKAPVTVLRSGEDGRVLMTLDKADISRLVANGWKAPEQFVAPGRDGKTLMYGVIYRPTNFDPTKKYPVIEYIYQGPGDQYVQKNFRSYDWCMSSLAELGFICVMVDGMGTSWRSREFENICYKNLVDAGIPDHIAWIKAAGEKYPYMDLDRVGIFGCSAGGQESTSALLLHPEFYKCAYSACGCHDNRMDKIWWNEQWLGYPIGDQYKAGSNVENAHLLQHPLMLCVGEMDDNVDPASTMQVVNALEKAGKDFELIVIPGAHHTMGEDFGEHKRYDFFVRNLLHVWPPEWSEIRP